MGGRIVIIGPIRQELLSGISDISQFNKLKDMLSAFEDISLESRICLVSEWIRIVVTEETLLKK